MPANVIVVGDLPEGGDIGGVHQLLTVQVQGPALAMVCPAEQVGVIPGDLDAAGLVRGQVHHVDALVVLRDHVDKVQLLLGFHQLFGLEEEDVLLLLQLPFLLQLPHLGLGDLSDKDIALGLAGAGVPEVVELGGVPLIARGPVHLYPVLLKGRGTARQEGGQQGRAFHGLAVLLPVPGMDGGADVVSDKHAVRSVRPGPLKQVLVGLGSPEQPPGVLLQGDFQPGHGAVHHPGEELGGLLPAVALLDLLGHVPNGADGGGLLIVGQGLHPQLNPGFLLVHGLELHFAVLAQGGLLQGGQEGGLPLGGAVEVGQQAARGFQGGFQLPALALARGENPDHPVGEQLKQPHIPPGKGGVHQEVAPGHLLVQLVPVAAVADELIQQHRHCGQGVDEDQQVVFNFQLQHHRQAHKADP